jgi:hypothetical protein
MERTWRGEKRVKGEETDKSEGDGEGKERMRRGEGEVWPLLRRAPGHIYIYIYIYIYAPGQVTYDRSLKAEDEFLVDE